MVVLNLLATGGVGGIEVLCKSVIESADWENYIAFVFDGGKLEEEIHFNKFVISRGNRKRLNSQLYKKIVDICIEHKVEIIVIHHQNWFLQRILIKVCKELPTIKTIFMIHHCYDKDMDLGHNPVVAIIRYYYLRLSLKLTDRIFAVSYAGMNSYRSKFPTINQEKFRVVYNGIDQNLIDMGKTNVPLLEDEFRILYIGRLEKVKGIDLLIRALPHIDANRKILLTIIGTGSIEKELKKIADGISSESCTVEFLGVQREKDVYLRKASAFVYPSICQEVFGISVVEAMAYGLPCVTNRVGGLPEIIEDGKNGLFTNEKSPEALAACLREILSRYENGSIKNMFIFAKATARRFSINNTCNQLKSEYQDLLRS